MFAQQTSYRPEIARVAEETVLNLKQLESRIEVLRNDLAALCTVLGHPEAARIAVTPPAWLGITPHSAVGNVGGVGAFGSFGQTPFQGTMPYGVGQSPYGISPLTQGVSSPWLQQGITPWAQQSMPWAQQGLPPVSPYGAFSPYQGYNVPTFSVSPFGSPPGLTPPYPPIR